MNQQFYSPTNIDASRDLLNAYYVSVWFFASFQRGPTLDAHFTIMIRRFRETAIAIPVRSCYCPKFDIWYGFLALEHDMQSKNGAFLHKRRHWAAVTP